VVSNCCESSFADVDSQSSGASCQQNSIDTRRQDSTETGKSKTRSQQRQQDCMFTKGPSTVSARTGMYVWNIQMHWKHLIIYSEWSKKVVPLFYFAITSANVHWF